MLQVPTTSFLKRSRDAQEDLGEFPSLKKRHFDLPSTSSLNLLSRLDIINKYLTTVTFTPVLAKYLDDQLLTWGKTAMLESIEMPPG